MKQQELDPKPNAGQGGSPDPCDPDRQDEARERPQSPEGQGDQRESDDSKRIEPAREQDDFGGIGQPDPGGEAQRPRDPSRER